MTELSDKRRPMTEADAIQRLDDEVDLHKQYLDKQSHLSSFVSNIWGGDSDSLKQLTDLQQNIKSAQQRGDKAEVSRLAQEAQKVAADDRETLIKHEKYSGYIGGAIKTAGLFMRGAPAVTLCIGSYALDQMRVGDSARDNFKDAVLGGSKGFLLNRSFHYLGGTSASPFAKGVGMGFTAHTLDNVLNRHNYKGTDLSSLASGFGSGLSKSLDAKALAAEGIVFTLGIGAVGKAEAITGGAIARSPMIKTMLTGTSFGMSSGAVSEITRQQETPGEKFDLGKIIKSSLIHGAIDTVAAAPGGMQARAMFRAGSESSIANLEAAAKGSDRMALVREFKITSGTEALSAFARGERTDSGLVKVRELMEGRPGKERTLFVQHLEPGTALNRAAALQADLLVMCNPKDLPAAARSKHLFPESAGSIFLKMADGKVKFSPTESLLGRGEPALALGKPTRVVDVLESQGRSDYAELLADSAKYRNMKAVRWLGEGNESVAVEVAPTPDAPDGAALKITIPEGGWQNAWGKRPFDAKMFGKMEELDVDGANANVYRQELVDFKDKYDSEDVNAFMRKVEEAGLEFADPGADPTKQIGYSRITGELVLIDYAAVDKKGANETHQQIVGGAERAEAEYEAENEARRTGKEERDEPAEDMETLDIDVELKRQDALQDKSLTPGQRSILKSLFMGDSIEDAAITRSAEANDWSEKGMKEAKAEAKAMRTWAIKRGLLEKS